MESAIGLYKTELVKRKGPWKTLADGELATAEHADWFNNKQLHDAIGNIPRAEHKASYSAQAQARLLTRSHELKPPPNPARFKPPYNRYLRPGPMCGQGGYASSLK